MVQFSRYPTPYSPFRELDLMLDTWLLNVVIVQRNEGLFSLSQYNDSMDPYDLDDSHKNQPQNGDIKGVCWLLYFPFFI